jgi:hypothetical protein
MAHEDFIDRVGRDTAPLEGSTDGCGTEVRRRKRGKLAEETAHRSPNGRGDVHGSGHGNEFGRKINGSWQSDGVARVDLAHALHISVQHAAFRTAEKASQVDLV